MKAAKTNNFNTFLRDNRSKLSNRYPFLSQGQIFSKLKQQWKKLNTSLLQSSVKKELSYRNRQYAFPQSSCRKSRNNSLRSDKISNSRKPVLIFQQNNESQSVDTCVYDFVDSGYESPIFRDDEIEVDSPYLFAKHAVDALNNWKTPALHFKDVGIIKSNQAYHVPESNGDFKCRDSSQRSKAIIYDNSVTSANLKPHTKKKIQKDPTAKVWYQTKSNLNAEVKVDPFDFDDEKFYIEEHRRVDTYSAATKQKQSQNHHSSKSQVEKAKRNCKKQNFGPSVGEMKIECKDRKLKQRCPKRRNDDIPLRFSKRLSGNLLQKSSHAERRKVTKSKVNFFKSPKNRAGPAVIYDKNLEQTYAQQGKAKFRFKARSYAQRKSHKEQTIKGHRFNMQTGTVKNFSLTPLNCRKIMQYNITSGKCKTRKGKKTKDISDFNDKVIPGPSRKYLEQYGSPNSVDQDRFEDDVLIFRQDFSPYSKNFKEQSARTSSFPSQNDYVNEQNANCTMVKSTKYQENSTPTLVVSGSDESEEMLLNTKCNQAPGKKCEAVHDQNVTTGTKKDKSEFIKTKNENKISSPNDSEDVDLLGSVDHYVCSDDEDAFLIVRQSVTSYDTNSKEQRRPILSNISSSQNKIYKYVDEHSLTSSKSELAKNCEDLPVNLVRDALQQKKMSYDTKFNNATNERCIAQDNQYNTRRSSREQKKMKSSPLTNTEQERSVSNAKNVLTNVSSRNVRRTSSKFVPKWRSKSANECWDIYSGKNEDGQDELSWNTGSASSIASENLDKISVDGLDIFEDENGCSVVCSQRVTEADSVLKHALVNVKAPEAYPETRANADDVQSTCASTVSSQNSATFNSDNSIFKEPLGIMFQDPVSETCVSVDTPGKRRLISNAEAATSSNFGSMFEALDMFM